MELVMVLALVATTIVLILLALVGASTRRQVAEVHVLVNSEMDRVTNRVDQLIAALDASGTAVPPAPSAPQPVRGQDHE